MDYFFLLDGGLEREAPTAYKDLYHIISYHIMDVLYAGKHGDRYDQVQKYTLARKRGSACICDNAFKLFKF